MPTIDLTDAELEAVAALLRGVIEQDRFPRAPRRLRCGQCGGKQINTRPTWHTAAARRLRPFRAY